MRVHSNSFQYLGTRTLQQDNFYFDDDYGIAIVSDGIGSNVDSGLFSGELVATLAESLKINSFQDFQFIEVFKNFSKEFLLRHANISDYKNLGATLALCKITENYVEVGHIGDSKIYIFKNKALIYESRDHNLFNELENQLEGDDLITIKPQIINQLTRAILVNTQDSELEYRKVEFSNEDELCILLCTDGVTPFAGQCLQKDLKLEQGFFDQLNILCQREASDNATAIFTHIEIENKAKISLSNFMFYLIIVSFVFIGILFAYYSM